jgi:hypothetical protein
VAVFGDFDNDGWVDMVVLDRRGRPGVDPRPILFMNRGDGTFEPKPTAFSGLTGVAITAEVADFDNDGLLDLFFAADPDNSGTPTSLDQYESQLYRNTGQFGGRGNHWLRVRLAGVNDAALIGSRVEVRDAGAARLLGSRVIASDQGYKTGSPLEAHFGLGQHRCVDVDVILPSRKVHFPNVTADRLVECDVVTRGVTAFTPAHDSTRSGLTRSARAEPCRP